MGKNISKAFWVSLGLLSLVIGSIGIVLPFLPTVPFYMLTVFCFAKSSERLHAWFINTKVYEKHLKSFKERKGMTVKTKVYILTSVTIVMAIGFLMMKNTLVGRSCLAIVWIGHLYYFIFRVKTIKE